MRGFLKKYFQFHFLYLSAHGPPNRLAQVWIQENVAAVEGNKKAIEDVLTHTKELEQWIDQNKDGIKSNKKWIQKNAAGIRENSYLIEKNRAVLNSTQKFVRRAATASDGLLYFLLVIPVVWSLMFFDVFYCLQLM